MWLLLQMQCPVIGPFIFSFWFNHDQLVDPGQVLHVRLKLPCKTFRQLSPYCVKWLFSCLVRWFPCIWITTLQTFMYIIMTVDSFSFQTGLSDIESDQQVQYYSYSSIHSFLALSKQDFEFEDYQRWNSWHPHVPMNINIITPWKVHYLWGHWC